MVSINGLLNQRVCTHNGYDVREFFYEACFLESFGPIDCSLKHTLPSSLQMIYWRVKIIRHMEVLRLK